MNDDPGESAPNVVRGTSAIDAGARGADATPDAGLDASSPTRTFACGDRRCALGAEVCCGQDIDEPVCRPAASPGTCDGIAHCGDSSECAADEQCCWSGRTGTAACTASCSGTVLCDPSQPTCPDGRKCTPSYWGPYYCQ